MITSIITDIEGTTTSIRFVYDVLFPYARQHLGDFVRQHESDPPVTECLNEVRQAVGVQLDTKGVISQLEDWMQEDKKVTPLKTLQGLVWEAGYRNGDFKGHLYPDAYNQLQLWHKHGISLSVYSSGSVKAQQLLFAHTEYGDLQYLFDAFYDTSIGAKTEPSSYQAIIKKTGKDPDTVLFLSDVEKELQAADKAGMKVCWLMREGDLDAAAAYCQVRDFTQISAHFPMGLEK